MKPDFAILAEIWHNGATASTEAADEDGTVPKACPALRTECVNYEEDFSI